MGIVFVAEDTRLRRTVALKVLHGAVGDDSERRYRFLREGRLAAGLTHPCIATVYEVGESGDQLYIAMELVEGRSVGAMLKEQQRLPLFQSVRIAREVVRGLVKAHEAGIVHRDLKPENVMYGEDQVVKILDFGVAKRADDASANVTAHETKAGSLVGTPAYMSPEQAAGRAVDARSDIFSVGVMLYEMLAGQRPFEGETWQEVIISVARDPLVPASKHRPELPSSVDALLARCLEKKADKRTQSARALLDDLEALLLEVASKQQDSEVADLITLMTSGTRTRMEDQSSISGVGIGSDADRRLVPESSSRSTRPRWVAPAVALGAAVAVVATSIAVAPMLFTAPKASSAAAELSPASSLEKTAATEEAPPSEGPVAPAHTPSAKPSSSTEPATSAAHLKPPPTRVYPGGNISSPVVTAKPPPEPTRPAPAKANKQNPVLGF